MKEIVKIVIGSLVYWALIVALVSVLLRCGVGYGAGCETFSYRFANALNNVFESLFSLYLLTFTLFLSWAINKINKKWGLVWFGIVLLIPTLVLIVFT